jgi:hypothetical protein
MSQPSQTAFFDEYQVEFGLTNTGEMTIRDFYAVISFSCREGFMCDPTLTFRLRDSMQVSNMGMTTYVPEERKVFPGMNYPLVKCRLAVPEGRTLADGAFKASCTAFMDDIQPVRHEIDLSHECELRLSVKGTGTPGAG